MEIIARIHNDFPSKFGLPRQSNLAPSLRSRITFEPAYRNIDAVRGLEGFSYIWLLWEFSESVRPEGGWSPTVRPPRLGGNTRMGVFATRSPFRPNPIGLSCVKLEAVDLNDPDAPVLVVSGADLMDGTPIYDIKPYLPGVEAHPEALDGFVGAHPQHLLKVDIPEDVRARLLESINPNQLQSLTEILSQDPRPAYHDDPKRVYGFVYAGLEIRFCIENETVIAL